METGSIRARMFGRVAIAHVVGLWVVGMYGTIGTTSGFSVWGGALGLLLGGLMSVPWLIVLGIVLWFRAAWLDRRPILFASVGPLLVCGSWALLSGGIMWSEVAISCIVASLVFLGLTLWGRRERPPVPDTAET